MSATDPSPMKPAPLVTADTRAFWDACAEGVLTFQRCAACGHVQFPPRPFCTACRAEGPVTERSTGLGTIHSFTIVHRAPTAAFKADTPYVLALVDFDEGFRLMVNLRGCPPSDARIGLRVRVLFEPLAGGGALPQVRLLVE
ncbi:Zn-ribbon domain-containing OB-fold protein [Azospirillum brasilense]|uniref:Zn-ribbon domain-containing OB-fold protein n=1 Tax=Azospirillum brasilense TaxID=192 RepID=A0A6L3AZY0_AZOBR|nr:Zn-ribbon domain-containing OB-fold protein [Azospirillum brasilense]KAA0684929.1 Zn-ribbon domain-containing OB-fold protein [Azospirillum brasilense]